MKTKNNTSYQTPLSNTLNNVSLEELLSKGKISNETYQKVISAKKYIE